MLNNKVAVVTGAGSGIGRAIALALAENEVNIALLGRNISALKETQELINSKAHVKTLIAEVDVREGQQVKTAIDQVLKDLGHIDVLINNAGLGVQHLVEECPETDWDLVMNTNAKGTFLLSKAVLPNMKKSGGTIINIASQAAKNGYERAAPYCASKFAVLGFGLALQEEVRQFGIKVHSLCPGLVQVPKPISVSEQLPGWLQVDDLANSVIYLLQQPKGVFIENIGMYGIDMK